MPKVYEPKEPKEEWFLRLVPEENAPYLAVVDDKGRCILKLCRFTPRGVERYYYSKDSAERLKKNAGIPSEEFKNNAYWLANPF